MARKKFPGAETGLMPDVGFYTAARDALVVDDEKPIPFEPDLAVEVASPSQSVREMAAKDGKDFPVKEPEHPIQIFARAFGLMEA